MLEESTGSEQAAAHRARRRGWSNKAAGVVISFGGAGVIAVVVAIFVFIGYETLPLWLPASVGEQSRVRNTEIPILAIAGNEYRTAGSAVDASGLVLFHPVTGEFTSRKSLPGDISALSAAFDPSQRYLLVVDTDARGYFFDLSFVYDGFNKVVSGVEIASLASFQAPYTDLRSLDLQAVGPDQLFALIVGAHGEAVLVRAQTPRSLFGGSTVEVSLVRLAPIGAGQVLSGAVDRYGEKVVLGTDRGELISWDTRNPDAPLFVESTRAVETGISSLKFMPGGQAVILGTREGEVKTYTWALDPSSPAGRGLVPLNAFAAHNGAVTTIAVAVRNKTFLTGDDRGEVALHYQTTGETFYRKRVASTGIQGAAIAPRADGFLVLAADGTVISDSLHHAHPEVRAHILFGKVQYEGYATGSFTWQSTGGTDDFEPKFSLTPLLFGTIKGALYALVFALPMAILAALYTALFAHPRIRNIVKPVIELMAALPSVVIGFIAALWLAPLLERHFVDVMVLALLFPVAVFVVYGMWGLLPRSFTNRLLFGSEILLLLPVLAALMIAGTLIGPAVEQWLFGGSIRQWLFESWQITFDQRNSIVVGFAMGFAVIPIIFTISEDALSSVPEHLIAGSLALGATRWQTATRVVLPTASPGIFSGAMVGFGRAVGETMIVLMATGNTPLMDLSPFVGMRTLSANIAVEIPEAPHLGTLYRILFLSGLLLFAFTFTVNTVAELIRQRLRKRYSTI